MHLPVSLLPSHRWTLAVPLVVTHFNIQLLHSICINFVITESEDYLPILNAFVFSQQENAVQCASVTLLEDDDPTEGTEQFTVTLSMSSPVADVILSPDSATISISDSVASIFSNLSVIAGGDEQTEDNLQFISGVVQDIVNSALNGELEVNMEVWIVSSYV